MLVGLGWVGLGRASGLAGRAGQGRAGQDREVLGWAGLELDQGKGHGMVWHGIAGQGSARQGKEVRDNAKGNALDK